MVLTQTLMAMYNMNISSEMIIEIKEVVWKAVEYVEKTKWKTNETCENDGISAF